MAKKIPQIKNYINGQWVASKTDDYLDVIDPGTGESIAQVPLSTKEEVKQAAQAAEQAFVGWSQVPAPQRVEPLFKLKYFLEESKEEIARLLTREHGKTLKEAIGEVKRALQNIETACGIPSLMQGKVLPNIAENMDEYFIRQPVGPSAVIMPFNFPAMIATWYFPYALACGCTVIVKPSELTPLTQNKFFELIDQAGFPPGVISLINGAKETAQAIIENDAIKAVASVSSTPVAKSIYQKCAEQGKRACCQGGAKNFLVVAEDADLDKSMSNMINSAFGNAGQRCLAGSIMIGIGEIYDQLKEKVVKAAKELKVSYGLEEGVEMGPVISVRAKERIISSIEKGIAEGAKLILDGRKIKVDKYPDGFYLGPSIFDQVDPQMSVAREEIFGPVLGLLKVDSLEEAINLIDQSPFGNAASIYTSSGRKAQIFKGKVKCGNIGIQVGTVAPLAYFPFSGMKNSFFGTLHAQGQDAVDFFTEKKVIVERWW